MYSNTIKVKSSKGIRISVLIIAHNEEKYIAESIKSVLNQSKHPDEIVLVVHNSTDKTLEIAKSFPISVIPFNGPAGIINARLEGLKNVSGDIILCIDGDSVAQKNWVEVMSATLQHKKNVLVGSWVKFRGTIFGNIYNIFNKHACRLNNEKTTYWIWGSSHAFWSKDINLIREILTKSTPLSSNLHLPRNPEDYWLALFMSKHGNLKVTNKTWVTPYSKDPSSWREFLRRKESVKNRNLIKDYFQKNFI